MVFKRIRYKLKSGKNSKLSYYSRNTFRQCIPSFLYRLRLNAEIESFKNNDDYEYIMSRVDYYNKLSLSSSLPESATLLSSHKMPKKQKVYFFDTYEYTRWFSPDFRWGYLPGDIIHVPEYPSIVKSRPLTAYNENSILMRLDKVRHFIFIDDNLNFSEKKDALIFRGKIDGKESRVDFMSKYFDHPMCDLGNVSKNSNHPSRWQTEKKTLKEHLEYKFILALEGNDVASNLKWIMSSNSIAIMPRPTCETWFMEGTLIPNYHYIEIKSDFSDLEEKMEYYIKHEDESLAIIDNANRYVEQFKNPKREKIISLLVLDKYFRLTNQK